MAQAPDLQSAARRSGRNVVKLILSIASYVVTSSALNIYLPEFLGDLSEDLATTYIQYLPYVNPAPILGFGYLMVIAFSNLIYWNLRLRHPHSTAKVVRNAIKIMGLGVLIASAVGGFMGIVAGFATRKVFGQAVAGLFLLILQPFKIGDRVVVSGGGGRQGHNHLLHLDREAGRRPGPDPERWGDRREDNPQERGASKR